MDNSSFLISSCSKNPRLEAWLGPKVTIQSTHMCQGRSSPYIGDGHPILNDGNTYNLGCPPAQDASHHQDYDMFRIGDPETEPSFATGILGGGTTQLIMDIF